jgi:hypothetical protein
MAHKTKEPVPRGSAGRAQKNVVRFAASRSLIPHNADSLQDRRAVWLARPFRLAPTMAATVAEIAFSIGGAR